MVLRVQNGAKMSKVEHTELTSNTKKKKSILMTDSVCGEKVYIYIFT